MSTDAIKFAGFNLDTLSKVRGGLVERALVTAVQRQTEDLVSAPDIATARVVKLEIHLIPHTEQGELVDVVTEFKVISKAPPRVIGSNAIVRAHGRLGRQTLLFNLDAPDNPHQFPLPGMGHGSESDGDDS